MTMVAARHLRVGDRVYCSGTSRRITEVAPRADMPSTHTYLMFDSRPDSPAVILPGGQFLGGNSFEIRNSTLVDVTLGDTTTDRTCDLVADLFTRAIARGW